MARIKWVDENAATGELKELYDHWFAANPGRGTFPEILKCFSLRPDLLKHVMEASYQVHFQNGFLTRRVKEMIATYVSGLNRCPYWIGSHSFFLQLQGADREIAHALARGDLDAAPVADSERVLLSLVKTLTIAAYKTTDADIQALRKAGYSDPQIAEAVYITAFFAFFNRVADAFGLEDPNYFAAGGDRPAANQPAPGQTESWVVLSLAHPNHGNTETTENHGDHGEKLRETPEHKRLEGLEGHEEDLINHGVLELRRARRPQKHSWYYGSPPSVKKRSGRDRPPVDAL